MSGAPDPPHRGGEPPPLTDDALQEINRRWTVSRMLSNASHDLNNALQIISGNVEMLRAKGGLEPTVDRRTASINDQSLRAAAIVERLLSYARGSSGATQRIDLYTVAASALALRSVT